MENKTNKLSYSSYSSFLFKNVYDKRQEATLAHKESDKVRHKLVDQ